MNSVWIGEGIGLENWFVLANLVVLPFWLLVILLPRWRITLRVVASPGSLLLLPLFYTALVLPALGQFLPLLTAPSLAGIAAGLGEPRGALIAWVHFLAFDWFVGRWAFLDSRRRGLSPVWVSPVLLFIFMLGPLGLLLYLLGRRLAGRGASPAGAGVG